MASLKEVLLLIRWSGFRHIIRIIQNTLKRDLQDRQYLKDIFPTHTTPQIPGTLLGVTQITSGAQFKFQNASLEILFLSPDCIQVAWKPGLAPLPYAIQKRDWSSVEYQFEELSNGWQLKSSAISVVIHLDGQLKIKNQQDVLLRDELPPHFRGESDHAAWLSQASLTPEECIYGLGEQSDPFNLRRTSHRIWNHDPGGSYSSGFDPLYMPLPVYFSLHMGGSYLIFYENSFPANIHIDIPKQNSIDGTSHHEGNHYIQADFMGGQLRYYFLSGSPEEIYQRFAELTGFPAMPPLWSLGYHQCRWGYKTEAQIQDVVNGFQEYDMPISAIHLDIDYLDGYRVFTVDESRFPDLPRLANKLKQEGIRLVTIIDPGVKLDPDCFLYREGAQEDYFCKQPDGKTARGMVWSGWSAFPDFTDQNVRQWWGKQYKWLLDSGVSGFWHDMNEPASFTAWGDSTLPLSTMHFLEGHGGDHLQAHNIYGLLMNQAAYEGLRNLKPESRPWILSRSGWVSSERYTWTWTADTETSWDSLGMTIRTVLGTGLSGQPYSGPDIGGFRGDPSAELYTRFLQLATFMPFFRTHSAVGSQPREPWVYGEPYTSIIRRYLKFRYQLLPYLYTLAWEAHTKGLPLVRPLFWADPKNSDLWEIDDAFLLGDSLLIAPILEPQAIDRQLQLPPGEWISLWDQTHFQGPAKVTLPVQLEDIPILVRAGSILPMQRDNRLVLFITLPSTSANRFDEQQRIGQLYSDAGDGYGDWRLDTFYASQTGEFTTISWVSEGSYPIPFHEIEIQFHAFHPQKILLDGEALPISTSYTTTKKFSQLQIIH